jgi:hypothetical protein
MKVSLAGTRARWRNLPGIRMQRSKLLFLNCLFDSGKPAKALNAGRPFSRTKLRENHFPEYLAPR